MTIRRREFLASISAAVAASTALDSRTDNCFRYVVDFQ
jgi:hypothetical protein